MPYPESYPMQVNMYNNANGELLAYESWAY